MPRREHPTVRAPKANQRERALRQAAIDTLLHRGVHGVLTVPEAQALAENVWAERKLEGKTRERLTETTQALQRNREAADAEIQRLEARVEELEAALECGTGGTVDERAAA
ncbi:hypothetical protein ACIHCX_03230 [Streptomyces sp. NPDC052043]|uniref:hypothetical protein n=1 Tax=Streptomyces sp. NPDC052043 TaxID=3365684 RepID=UPI0037D0B4A0